MPINPIISAHRPVINVSSLRRKTPWFCRYSTGGTPVERHDSIMCKNWKAVRKCEDQMERDITGT
jgi:hypothetical protein